MCGWKRALFCDTDESAKQSKQLLGVVCAIRNLTPKEKRFVMGKLSMKKVLLTPEDLIVNSKASFPTGLPRLSQSFPRISDIFADPGCTGMKLDNL